jgi:hypothetical protein
MDIPPEVLKGFNTWLVFFQDLWWGETPIRIHQRDYAPDGAPDWHPEFARWLFADPPQREVLGGVHLDQRLRTTRAFRKLRKKAPREFDVLYLMVARKPPLGLRTVAGKLNERAIRHEKTDRYTENDILLLAISGLDKMMRWW